MNFLLVYFGKHFTCCTILAQDFAKSLSPNLVWRARLFHHGKAGGKLGPPLAPAMAMPSHCRALSWATGGTSRPLEGVRNLLLDPPSVLAPGVVIQARAGGDLWRMRPWPPCPSVSASSTLQTLDVNSIELTSMPDCLGQIAALQMWDVDNNELTSLIESLDSSRHYRRWTSAPKSRPPCPSSSASSRRSRRWKSTASCQ